MLQRLRTDDVIVDAMIWVPKQYSSVEEMLQWITSAGAQFVLDGETLTFWYGMAYDRFVVQPYDYVIKDEDDRLYACNRAVANLVFRRVD
jgi:hypothetical protein